MFFCVLNSSSRNPLLSIHLRFIHNKTGIFDNEKEIQMLDFDLKESFPLFVIQFLVKAIKDKTRRVATVKTPILIKKNHASIRT